MHMEMSCTKRRSFFLHQQFKCIKFECDCIKSFNDGLSLVASIEGCGHINLVIQTVFYWNTNWGIQNIVIQAVL